MRCGFVRTSFKTEVCEEPMKQRRYRGKQRVTEKMVEEHQKERSPRWAWKKRAR